MKFNEDTKYIYANDKSDVEYNYNLFKNGEYGSSSDIFYYKNKLLKVFYESLTIKDIDTYELLNELKLKCVITPKKYLIINDKFYGYTMSRFNGNMIIDNNPDTYLYSFLESLDLIKSDIKKISSVNIRMNDINYCNILYNNIKTKIVDVDCYQIDTTSNSKEIYESNMIDFYLTILIALIYNNNDKYDGSLSKSHFYKYIRYIINERLNFNKSISNNFKYLTSIVEESAKCKIKTINDFSNVFYLNR